MNQITITVNIDMTPEHAVAMLEDITDHVIRYNPRIIQGVSASTGGYYLEGFHGLKEKE